MNKVPIRKSSIFNLLKKIKKLKLGKEKIKLDRALGRYLNENLISKIKLPPFKNSAVDGYAILKNDIINKNNELVFSQRIAAGDESPKKINKGQFARIFTGAKMPSNSNTVVMQENVKLEKNKIIIKKMPLYGENCRFAGEDINKGTKILSDGDKINKTNINLIAAIGKKYIFVKKKIKIGFYTSGDELTNLTENLKGTQINNSNFYSLKALLEEPYIENKYLGILKDKKKLIEKSLLKSSLKYNIIIITGGASVGEEDYIIECINKIGKLYFWKTAIKPGRPLAVGKIKNTIVVCLPGNPVSVHLLYGMIISPFIKFLCNGKLSLPQPIKVKTDFTMKKKNKRLEWLRVNIFKINEEIIASKYKKQGSGMISSIAFSDGIIEIPEDVNLISKKDIFNFYSFKKLFE